MSREGKERVRAHGRSVELRIYYKHYISITKRLSRRGMANKDAR